MRALHSLPVIPRDEADFDPPLGDETKVHTLSRQKISELLVEAEREEQKRTPSRPPASGIRRRVVDEETLEAPHMAVPSNDPLPKFWDDDEEGLEPTILSECMLVAAPPPITTAKGVAIDVKPPSGSEKILCAASPPVFISLPQQPPPSPIRQPGIAFDLPALMIATGSFVVTLGMALWIILR